MEYSVKLAQLPPAVAIPDRLAERFRFDADRRLLVYRGFMTKCAYDEISALSDNLDYHRAVEELFVLTSAEVAPPKKPITTAILAATTAAAVILAALIWGAFRHTSAQGPAVPPPTATASTSP